MLASLEVALEEGAITRVIDKFVDALDFDSVTDRALHYSPDGKIIAVYALDSAAQEILPATVLCESTALVGNLFGQITHLQIAYGIKCNIHNHRTLQIDRLTTCMQQTHKRPKASAEGASTN
jgi:hypothetical protein